MAVIWLLISLCTLFVGRYQVISQTTPTEVCTRSSPPQNLIQKFENSFINPNTEHQGEVDLIFLVDRSSSANRQTILDKQKSAMMRIVDYNILIHPDHTRLALISFGKLTTTEFDGISSTANVIHGCEIHQRIESLTHYKGINNDSDIAHAMKDADRVFQQGRQTPSRKPKQILWVFFDGEKEYNKKAGGRQTSEWLNDMKSSGVEVFVAGIGKPNDGWLKIDGENVLFGIASDKEHYACVETWLDIWYLNTTSPELPRPTASEKPERFDTRETLFVVALPGACPADCVVPAHCACDVISRHYSCQSEDIVTTSTSVSVSTESSSTRRSKSTTHRPGNIPWHLEEVSWFFDQPLWVPIAVIVGATLILLIVIIILVCIVEKRRSKTRRDALVAPPPPPPLPLSTRRKQTIKTAANHEEEIYTNVESGVQDDSKKEICEENMPDWPDRLVEYMETNTGLRHLAIFSVKTHGPPLWAKTPGCLVTATEVKEIVRALRHSQNYKKEITIGQTQYTLDKSDLSEFYFKAKRQGYGLDGDSVAWVCKAGDYIVIGIAAPSADKKCEDVLYDIMKHVDVGQINQTTVFNAEYEDEFPPPVTQAVPQSMYSDIDNSGMDERKSLGQYTNHISFRK